MKRLLPIILITLSCNAMAEWVEYSTEPNGDVFYFDDSRIDTNNNNPIDVWIRVLYKTSVMGASSYQSLLVLDCIEGTEIISQNTFYTDRNWSKPAMATNTIAKPKKQIEPNSATERLLTFVCAD